MGSYKSHCTLDFIPYATKKGIILVTFPPRCSPRLQPLDVGMMGNFKVKQCVAQHYWVTANPGKVITVLDLTSLTNAAYQTSFTAKNITACMLSLVFGHSQDLPSVTRILNHHLLRLWKKELCNQEISVPSASSPAAREISGIGKDRLSTEKVRPLPKPEPMCNRRQRKKVKSHILTDSLLRIALNRKHVQGQL